MKYGIYKLKFPYGVHFGNKSLEKSNSTFCADTLFSALYIEALKTENLFKEFFGYVRNGQLLISDGFPYLGNELFLPKPFLHIAANDGSSESKKKFKKMKYVAMSNWDSFIRGELDPDTEYRLEKSIGCHETMTHVSIRGKDEAWPYRVGSFRFSENAGVYIIYGYENEDASDIFYDLLERLSFSGLGGERSSGLGRFEIYNGKLPDEIIDLFEKKSDRYVSLSIGLPNEKEMETCMVDANYELIKRSGFVESASYSDTYMRKRDLFMIASGSVFSKKYAGDIYDVSSGGTHPVYKYGKPIFMGV